MIKIKRTFSFVFFLINLIFLSIVILPKPVVAAKLIKTSQDVPINKIINIKITGSESFFVKFELENPSEVTISYNFGSNDSRDFSDSGLYDSNGDEIRIIEINSSKIETDKNYLRKGIYYLEVPGVPRNFQNHKNKEIEIKINATANPNGENELNDTSGSSSLIDPNNSIKGNFKNFNDNDWFQINIPSDGTIQLEMSHTFNDTKDVVIRSHFFNSEMNEILNFDYLGNNSDKLTSQKIGLPAGTYFFNIKPITCWDSTEYNFRFIYSGQNDWEKELNDSPEKANLIESNKYINGSSRQKNDDDWFKLDINSNSLKIGMKHSYIDLNYYVLTVRLYNQNLEFIKSFSYYGNKTSLETSENIDISPGTYYIEVEPFYDNVITEYNLIINTTNSSEIPEPQPEEKPNINYQTHIENIGWQNITSNGQTSGTTGQSLRLEAIRINSPISGLNLEYKTHVENIGWTDYVQNNEISGTTGLALRLEAIQIKITGPNNNWDVYYRVHAQDVGWMNWAKNDEPAGTAGFARRLEAIQIVLVAKGQTPSIPEDSPNATDVAFLQQ